MNKPYYFVSLHYIYFKDPLDTSHGYTGSMAHRLETTALRLQLHNFEKILLGLHSQS